MSKKLSFQRYAKFMTVYNKLSSLRDSFEGDKDIPLSNGNVSFHTQLDIALASLDCIFQEL